MQYNEGARLDASQVETRGAGGGGGRIAVGGVSGIIVLILALVFGINPSEIMGGGGGSASGAASGTDMSQCQTGADVAKDRECRFVVYANSVNEYWSQTLQGYQPAKTVLFSGQTATGCGTATTDVGPFYCPTDKQAYPDTTFTQDMLQGQLGGMGGDAAEAYVIGHEYGHHVQDLRGVLAQVQQSGNATGANSPQVKLELQADCLAGAYLASVTSLPNSPISSINQDDLNRIVDAAKVVGDDYIQRRSSGTVNPDSWTHGSSAMRKHWLAQGFNSGNPQVCDNVFSSTN